MLALLVGVCVVLTTYIVFLFVSRRRLQATAFSSTVIAAEIRAQFELSREENEALVLKVDSLSHTKEQLIQMGEELSDVQKRLIFEQEQYKKLIGQKKSSEVRTGKITEQISPFLADYPLDPATARFIGEPLDFIHFDEDKITFVEVKSGKSQLSKKQRVLRDLIVAGKVEFILYRVEGK